MKPFAWTLLTATALGHPADLWWATEDCFASPERVNNVCSDAQKQGFDWSQMAEEQACAIDGFQFQGFTPKIDCQPSGGNCIQGTLNGAPRISTQQTPFSVQSFHLTTSSEVNVLITYTLADETTCRQTVPCSPSGTEVVNDQCGGAIAVDFQLAEFYSVSAVDLELHQMDFDCSSGPKLMEDFPGTPVDLPAMPAVPTDWPGWATNILPTPSGSTSTSPPGPTLPSSPVPEPSGLTDCPEVMPKCLNTWLSVPQCDSNNDTACFCPSPEFSTKINSCIHSWSSSEEERDSALTYFAAICAPYVATNPEIISLCPTSAIVTAAPELTVSEPPCTTITYSTLTATLPQVCFSTYPAVSTTSVVLVTGTPAPTSSVPAVRPTEDCSTTTDLVITSASPSETPVPVVAPPTEDYETHVESVEDATVSAPSHPTISPSPAVAEVTLPCSTETVSPTMTQPTGDCDCTTAPSQPISAFQPLVSASVPPSSANTVTSILAKPTEPCDDEVELVDENPVLTSSAPVITSTPVVAETHAIIPTATASDRDTPAPTDLEVLEEDVKEKTAFLPSSLPASFSEEARGTTTFNSFVTVSTPATTARTSSSEANSAPSSSASTTVPESTARPTDSGIVYQGLGFRTRAGSVLMFGTVFSVLLLQ